MLHFIKISILLISASIVPSFHSYHIPTFGQHALIIGCSSLVGIPCFFLLQQLGMTCTMANEHTPNTPELCRSADLVVSAVGNPGMIKGDWLKPGATVIDIGTRCVKDRNGACNFMLFIV